MEKAKRTFDTYAVGRDSNLLYHLDGGIQEEYLADMAEVLTELKGTEEYDDFLEQVDAECDNVLLIKAW